MGFSLRYAPNGVWYGRFAHFPAELVTHAVSTRLGGVSQAPYLSLNLALHTGDQVSSVVLNRHKFCEAAGVDAARVVTTQQVHGDKVMAVSAPEAGRGAEAFADALAATDALITNTPNLPLLLFFADCVPVLILDPVNKAIAVVHAGWKGTAAGIVQKTIREMQTHFGTEPENCVSGIAPSIGPCCYEVDTGVAEVFQGRFTDWGAFLTPSGHKWRLDLWRANYNQLAAAGLSAENIVISGICTACNAGLFFSYRAENGLTGRIGAVMSLK